MSVVSSLNLYIDTSKVVDGTGNRGDVFQTTLGSRSILANSGQRIRVSLQNFNMAKTWCDINDQNNNIQFTNNISGITLRVPPANYKTLFDLANAMAQVIIAQIKIDVPAIISCTITNITPDSTTTINGTADNIIRFQINCFSDLANTIPQNTGYTSVLLQSYLDKGEGAYVFGGDKIYITDPITKPSYTFTNVGGNSILNFSGFYQAIRTGNMPLIYLRANLNNQAIQTSSLQQPTGQEVLSDVFGTDILGIIPVNTEYCTYAVQYESFTLDVGQKNLSNIRLYLTDQRNCPIGRAFGSGSQTAFGTTSGLAQSTRGNLAFSCVIKIEVLEDLNYNLNNKLQLPKQPIGSANIHQPQTFYQ